MSSNVATIRKQGFLIRNTRNYLIAHSFGIIIKKDRPFGQDPCLRSRTQSKYRSHLNDTPSVDQKRKTVFKKRFGHVFCVFRKPTTYNLGPYELQIIFDQKTNSRDHVDMMFLGIRSTTEGTPFEHNGLSIRRPAKTYIKWNKTFWIRSKLIDAIWTLLGVRNTHKKHRHHLKLELLFDQKRRKLGKPFHDWDNYYMMFFGHKETHLRTRSEIMLFGIRSSTKQKPFENKGFDQKHTNKTKHVNMQRILD